MPSSLGQMSKDVIQYVKSCDVCLRVNAAGNKAAKMVERPIISVPFDSITIDIVRPLPKAKGGVKFLLTYICMATRWPEAVPMRTCSARPMLAKAVESGVDWA